MIPTMILFGLVLGRWWRSAVVAAAVIWPVLAWGPVRAAPGDDLVTGLVQASFLGAGNAAVGAVVHQACLWVVRRLVRRHHSRRRVGQGFRSSS